VFIEKYKYATKREKIIILNEFIEYTGHNSSYARRVLRNKDHARSSGGIKKHAPRYDNEVKAVLKKIWETADYLCGKRLMPIIPEFVRKLDEFNEMDIPEPVKGETVQSMPCMR